MTLVEPALANRTSAVRETRPETIRGTPVRLFLIGPAQTSSLIQEFLPDGTLIEFKRTVATGNIAESSVSSAAPEVISSGALIRNVREAAGLTWDQIARVFGVSRRAVHHWAAGENMSAHNLEMVARFERLVARLPGQSAEEKRAALFAADEFGVAPIDAFRTMASNLPVLVKPRIASHSVLFDAK